MAELLKNIYNRAFFDAFTSIFQEVAPSFSTSQFLNEIFDDEWEDRELKQRLRHTTNSLRGQLSGNFEQDVSCILHFVKSWQERGIHVGPNDDLAFMFLPDYLEQYGLEHFDTVMNATEVITAFSSCEFSIRPFIIKYPEESMTQMLAWSTHEDLHVRRLASEGSRPRLPWAMAIPALKKDPTPILPILENLKNDPSEYVRRSVANNLNDIAKDNPELVVKIAKHWKDHSKNTDWVIKHGSRTLLKQGNQELMELFGFGKVDKIKLSNFKINTAVVRIGEPLDFSFDLTNTNASTSKIRLEYGLYYQKANATLSKKVFKISEKDYAAHSSTSIRRQQSFKIITTRKFHIGKHQVSIIINGKEFDKKDFELVN
ncbi:DNA alkylation repair protein [Poritiphilus flavus]|uniref:DNA alkylation repair protein n=1 Tax=Poritiphilus flavus TaxID=2697053 RepID=A0A6L9EF56_9FLAO|nr:DNA alkylation repair protein [Poritiphilus flavus]NAS13311.1 DNA alkylation repair protein [Poritiphilus flavus]